MTEIFMIDHLNGLSQFAESWDRLRKEQRFFVPKFDALVFHLAESSQKFRIVAIKEGDQISSLACLIFERGRKRFVIGERKLFSLPVRTVSLFGSAILG